MKSWTETNPGKPFRPQNGSANSKKWVFSIVFRLVCMLGIVFFIGYKRINCNERAAKTMRELERVKQEIHLKERSIENLRMNKERLSDFKYIQNKNRTLNLGLRPATDKQIRRTALLRRPDAESFISSDEEMRTAQR